MGLIQQTRAKNQDAGVNWIQVGRDLNEISNFTIDQEKGLYDRINSFSGDEAKQQEIIRNWDNKASLSKLYEDIEERNSRLKRYQDTLNKYGSMVFGDNSQKLSDYFGGLVQNYDNAMKGIAQRNEFFNRFSTPDELSSYWTEFDHNEQLNDPNYGAEIGAKIAAAEGEKAQAAATFDERVASQYDTPEWNASRGQKEKLIINQRNEENQKYDNQINQLKQELREWEDRQKLLSFEPDFQNEEFQKNKEYKPSNYSNSRWSIDANARENLDHENIAYYGLKGIYGDEEGLKKYKNANGEYGVGNAILLEGNASNEVGQLAKYLTKEEFDNYNLLRNNKGAKKAMEYFDALRLTLFERMRLDQSEQAKEFAENVPVISDLVTVGSRVLAQPLTPIADAIRSATGTTYAGLEGEMSRLVNDQINTIRGTRAEDLGTVGGFVYNVGMSIADSTAAVALTAFTGNASAPAALMASSAASSGYADALDRGITGAGAVASGLAAGFAEFAGEKIGFDKLFAAKKAGAASVKSFLKNTLSGAAAEGLGEGTTTIVNTLSDIVINGDLSEYQKAIQAYIDDEGLSQEEAQGKAFLDFLGQTGLDALAGAISGAAMSGGASAITNHQFAKVGKKVKSINGVDALKEYGLSLDPKSDAYSFASKLTNKSSNTAVGQAYRFIVDESMNSAKAKVSDRLSQLGSDPKNAEVLIAAANGIPTEKANKLMNSDSAFQQVFNEFRQGQHGGDAVLNMSSLSLKMSLGEKIPSDTEKIAQDVFQKSIDQKYSPVKDQGYNATSEDVYGNVPQNISSASGMPSSQNAQSPQVPLYSGENSGMYSDIARKVYNAGRDGMSYSEAKNIPGARVLTDNQFSEAYNAGTQEATRTQENKENSNTNILEDENAVKNDIDKIEKSPKHERADTENQKQSASKVDSDVSDSSTSVSEKETTSNMDGSNFSENTDVSKSLNDTDVSAESETNQNLKYKKPDDQWQGKNYTEGEEIPSLSKIVKTIKRFFNIPISKGKLTKNAYGIFKVKPESVRVQIDNAVPTISHELGHYFDKKYGLQESKYIKEVLRYLETNRKEWINHYKSSQKPGEAVAEFIRIYLLDSNYAQSMFPGAYNDLLNRIGEKDAKNLQKIAKMTNQYMAASNYDKAMAAVISRVQAKKDNRAGKTKISSAISLARKIKTTTYNFGGQIKNIGDDAFNRFMDWVNGRGKAVAALTSDYVPAPNGNMAPMRDANGKIVTDEEGNPIPLPSLKKLFEMTPGLDRDTFNTYLAVRRGRRLLNEGKTFVGADTLNDINALNEIISEIESMNPDYKTAAENLYSWEKAFQWTWKVETGMITPELFKKLWDMDPDYVPFQRNVEKGDFSGNVKRQNLSGIKRLKGSGLDILHPIETIEKQVMDTILSAQKNMVGQELAKAARAKDGIGYMLEEVPPDMVAKVVDVQSIKDNIMTQIIKMGGDVDTRSGALAIIDTELDSKIVNWVVKGPKENDILVVLENGKESYFQINDPYLLSNLTGMNETQRGIVMQMTQKASNLFKLVTTGAAPLFALTNTARDTLFGYYTSTELNPLVYVKDLVTSYWDMISKSEDYKRYKSLGGGQNHWYSTDKKLSSLEKELLPDVKKRNLAARLFKGLVDAKLGFKVILTLTEAAETAPRYAEFKRVKKKTGDANQAMRKANDLTVNFQMRGTRSRGIDAVFPYFNAAAQSTYKVAREIQASVTGKSESHFLTKMFTTSFLIMAIEFGWNYFINDDKDEYEKLSDYKKNNFWNFSLGDGKFVSLPKPQNAGAVSSAMERIVETLFKEDPDFAKETGSFFSYLGDVFLPPGVPNVFAGYDDMSQIARDWSGDSILGGAIEAFLTNQNYMGAPIVSAAYEKLEPNDQRNEKTSIVAKTLGDLSDAGVFGKIKLSPMQIDHLIDSYGGFIGDLIQGWTADEQDWVPGLANRFYSDNAYSNDILDTFYDDFEDIEKRKNSHPDDGEAQYLYKQYYSANSVLSALNKYAKENPDESRELKRMQADFVMAYTDVSDEVSEALIQIYESTDNDDIFPYKSLSRDYTRNGVKITMPLENYLLYVRDYYNTLDEQYREILNEGYSDEMTAEILAETKKDIDNFLSDQYKTKTETSENPIFDLYNFTFGQEESK